MKGHDVIIVGAGISGLSLAHYCAKSGLDTLILEKNDRTGGTFHSHRFGDEAKGFWIPATIPMEASSPSWRTAASSAGS